MTEREQSQVDDAPQVDNTYSRAGCWSFYLLALVAGLFFLFIFPATHALLFLMGLFVAAVILSAQDAEISLKSVLHTLRNPMSGIDISRQKITAFVTDHRKGVTISGFLLAIGFMSLAALHFKAGNPETDLATGVFWMLLGVIALGIAMTAHQQPAPLITLSQSPLTPDRSHAGIILSGILLLGLFAEINGQLLNLPFLRRISLDIQFLILCGGTGLLVWGFSGAPQLKRPQWQVTNWRATVPILSIFLLALMLRSWRLEAIYGLVDEALAIEYIFAAESDRTTALAQPLNRFSTTLVYSYMESKLAGLVGHNLSGLRAASALTGALTVVALYMLTKALFDRKTALIAAFLLATFPPHVHFSRIALANIADPLFGTLMLAFMARGIQRNRRLDWTVAGATLGLTQYFFEAGRLFYPPLLVLWIIALILMASPKSLSILWRGMVVMFLTGLFVGMPVYYTIFAQNVSRTARFEVSGDVNYWQEFIGNGVDSSQLQELFHRVTFPFRVYVHQPEIASFYGGKQAMIMPYLVPVFLLGIAYMLWRGKSPIFVVLLWLAATPLANSLLRNSAVYARYPVVFPAITLTIAVGLRYVLAILWRGEPRRLYKILLLFITVAMGIAQINYYFGTHLVTFSQELRYSKPYRDGFDAIMRTRNFTDDTMIYVISDPVADQGILRALLGFLHPSKNIVVSVLFPADVTSDFLAQLPPADNYAFFVVPGDEATVQVLSQFFELGEPQSSPYDIPQDKAYLLYFVDVTENE